ncbi:MAG: Na+/H+ antiporter NhaB [Granulosicoccus sp.]
MWHDHLCTIGISTKWFGLVWFGYEMRTPDKVRTIWVAFSEEQDEKRTHKETTELIIQGTVAIFFISVCTGFLYC